jgi:hypothetical protein
VKPHLVRISVPVEELLARLEEAVLLREVTAGLVVVLIPDGSVPRIAALDGVESVVPDRLEHPDMPLGPAQTGPSGEGEPPVTGR